jgi:hypothetical protein
MVCESAAKCAAAATASPTINEIILSEFTA